MPEALLKSRHHTKSRLCKSGNKHKKSHINGNWKKLTPKSYPNSSYCSQNTVLTWLYAAAYILFFRFLGRKFEKYCLFLAWKNVEKLFWTSNFGSFNPNNGIQLVLWWIFDCKSVFWMRGLEVRLSIRMRLIMKFVRY